MFHNCIVWKSEEDSTKPLFSFESCSIVFDSLNGNRSVTIRSEEPFKILSFSGEIAYFSPLSVRGRGVCLMDGHKVEVQFRAERKEEKSV